MTDLGPLASLAAELAAKPWAAQLAADARPEEYRRVQRFIASPFFAWRPFGWWQDRPWGGYNAERRNPCQVGYLASTSRHKWAMSGNRGGKTVAASMEDVADCLGLDPITKRPRGRFTPPIRVWVVSDTEDTAIDVVERTFAEQVFGTDTNGFLWELLRDSNQWTPGGGFRDHTIEFINGSTITVRYSSQGRNTFQGARLNKVRFDEVQPRDIYSECMARLVDLHGWFHAAATPIFDLQGGKGIPWVFEELYLKREQRNIEFHQWSMLDNPNLSEAAKQDLMSQWDEDEIEARVYGAFVPLGVRLAVPTKTIRALREFCRKPHLGTLTMSEDGKPEFTIEERE